MIIFFSRNIEKDDVKEEDNDDIDDCNYDEIIVTDADEDETPKTTPNNLEYQQQINSPNEAANMEVSKVVDNPYYNNFDETEKYDPKKFSINDATENSTVLQSNLNPYFS